MVEYQTVRSSRGWFRALAKLPIPEHTGIYKLHLAAKATLDTAEVRESVKLPPGICKDDWIAAQLIGIFEEVTQVVSVMEEVCTVATCPRMSAGKHVQYSWAAGPNSAAQALPAPEYMRALIAFSTERLGDRSIIPVDGAPIPKKEFRDLVGTLCKRFFRVYAHAYIHHFEPFQAYGVEAHLNFNFKHFLFFVLEFKLVSRIDMQPLSKLIQQFAGDRNVTGSEPSGRELEGADSDLGPALCD